MTHHQRCGSSYNAEKQAYGSPVPNVETIDCEEHDANPGADTAEDHTGARDKCSDQARAIEGARRWAANWTLAAWRVGL